MENCYFVTCVSRKVYKSLISEEYRELKWTCPLCSQDIHNETVRNQGGKISIAADELRKGAMAWMDLTMPGIKITYRL